MLLSAAAITFSTSHQAAEVACLIFGIASGAAMIPYTIIKEVNPDEVKGSATGAINFLTFGVTALIGPIFADLLGKGIRQHAKSCRTLSRERHLLDRRHSPRDPAECVSARDRTRAQKA